MLHPGASVPARAWGESRCREAVLALRADGWRVVVTGGDAERELTAAVAGADDGRLMTYGAVGVLAVGCVATGAVLVMRRRRA